MAAVPRRITKRRPNPSRELDLQSLKQAGASVARALALFEAGGVEKEVEANDATAAAQAALAIRFLEEFVDRRGDGEDGGESRGR
jgi:hypothetical protein